MIVSQSVPLYLQYNSNVIWSNTSFLSLAANKSFYNEKVRISNINFLCNFHGKSWSTTSDLMPYSVITFYVKKCLLFTVKRDSIICVSKWSFECDLDITKILITLQNSDIQIGAFIKVTVWHYSHHTIQYWTTMLHYKVHLHMYNLIIWLNHVCYIQIHQCINQFF